MSGSEPKRALQSAAFSTMAWLSSWSSPGENVRPSAGSTSSTEKNSADTLNAAIDVGSPAPVRLKPSPRMIAILSKLGACSRQATNSCPEIGRLASLEEARRSHIITSRSGSLKGKGLISTALIRLKIELFAPIPNASVRTATTVKPGLFASVRQPYRKSCTNPFMKASGSSDQDRRLTNRIYSLVSRLTREPHRQI